MIIKKRDGRVEQLSFDKVIYRLRKLCNDPILTPLTHVDPDIVAQQVVSRIYDGVTSCELDEEAARIAVNITENMEYQNLASRIIISNMHKSTEENFSTVMELLYNNKDANGNSAPILADDIIDIIRKHKTELDSVIKYERDYLFDYFGFKTLEKSYLQKLMNHETKQMVVVERPQHLYMRVAVGIHKDDIASAIKTYDLISQHFYTHASPTLFNSGTRLANLSSCFHEDTIVATVNRGPVKIKDVQIGDQVVTHKGNVKKVVQLHKNPLNDRKFYELNIAKTAPIKVTDNHELWAIKIQKVKNGKKHGEKRRMYDIEFVREYLAKDNCQLLSTEYKNIKTKLDFICFCGRETSASFESIYYGDIRCNSRECIFKRKVKYCKAKKYSEPQWISVKNLDRDDYVCIPNKLEEACKNEYMIDVQDFDNVIKYDNKVNYTYDVQYTDTHATVSTTYIVPTYSYQQTRKHQEINRKWVITPDVAKFIGVFYGDGHIMKTIGKDGNERIRGIGITIHSDNVDLIDFCVRVGENLFGIKANKHKMQNQNVTQVLFNSLAIGIVFKSLFGIYFDGKKIWSEMFKWGKKMICNLLEGLITTDGCVTKDGIVMLQMSNVQFMRDLYYLLRNNNIDVSYGNIHRQKNGTKDHITLNIPAKFINYDNIDKLYNDDRLSNIKVKKCRNQYSSINVNGFTFLPVRSKLELVNDLPDYVYTLGVEDDHSYNVEGIVATNCFLIGTEDSLEGIFKTFTDCGKISKVGGGIGVHISNIRAKGSVIRGTNGVSDGIVPMLKVYNQVSTYINQCLLPDITVFSKDGLKKMEDITTNDYLVTNDGSYKKVNEVIVNEKNEEIFKIYNTGSIDPLKCTGVHHIYAIEYTRGYSRTKLLSQLDRGIRQPQYVEATKLNTNHIMGYPIPTYENDLQEWTPELCRLYGIMLGDGNITFGQTNRYQITLNNTTKLSTKAFVIDLLNKYNIHYWIVNECEICFTYNEKSINKLKITHDMLYNENKEKRCKNEFLHLPKQKIAKLLKGLLESDGCKTSTGIWFINTSKELIQSVKYLFLRLGILVSCQLIDKVGQVMSYNNKNKPIIMRKKCYNIRIPNLKSLEDLDIFNNFDYATINKNYFVWNNIIWSRISKIEREHYTGKVYDFNMVDNHNYLTESGLVHNSGRRKGSFAMYIEPWHADIMEFLDMRKNQGHEELRARDLFYALWTPDLFMKQVEKNGDWYLMCPDECPGLNDAYGDNFERLYWSYVEQKKYKRVVKAQDVWTKILDSQIETGVPYIGYKDAVNKKCNQKALGTIKSSNLCVAPETMILTSKGYFPISKLENQDIEVWNGQEFSKTTVRKTGENQELLKVMLSNGSVLECTPYHKFYVVTGKRPSNYPRIKQIQANELIEGMKLIKCDYPIITDGLDNFPYPYEHGFFCADGTLEHNTDKNDYGHLCGDKTNQESSYCKRHEHMYKYTQSVGSNKCVAVIKGLPPADMFDKYVVPVNYNLEVKLRWLEGLCDGDGTVTKSDKLTGIQIGSIHKDFLDKVKYLLQTLGCDPKINVASNAGLRQLPNGKGGHDSYYCQQLYRLMITSYDTAKLHKLGFKPKRLQLSGVFPKNNTKHWIQVNSIEHTQRYSDTYCFTEEKRGMGIFNGILTGQCIEISLYSDNQEYAVCNLASIALPKFVEYKDDGKPFFNFEKLKEVAEYTVHPMNKVIDHNYYPTPETLKSNMAHRPLGIGAQGLADVYFKMKLPFESKEAAQLNKEIFETIYYGTLRGSVELAKIDGKYASFDGSPFSEGKFQFDLAAEFDGINLNDYLSGRWDWDGLRKDLKEYGARNSMLVALMPTASSAQIMGNTESFEPIDSCIFKRRVLSGEYMVVNKYLVKDLEQLGLWNKEMKDLIIAHDGSIQNIPTIPNDIKRVYKTVWELSMKSVIEQCRDRGVFVDQMQSMNLFMANANYKKLTSMHFYAWKNHLKSGMYYLRSRNSAAAGKFSIDANLEKQIREKQEAGTQLTQKEEQLICSIDNKEECMMCSS